MRSSLAILASALLPLAQAAAQTASVFTDPGAFRDALAGATTVIGFDDVDAPSGEVSISSDRYLDQGVPYGCINSGVDPARGKRSPD